MWRSIRFACAALGMAVLASAGAVEPSGRLDIELNRLQDLDGKCRAFFLLRNGIASTFTEFSTSVAILDTRGIIGPLLSVDAAPLPALRTSLRFFDVPEVRCDAVGEILVHQIGRCTLETGEAPECFDLIDLRSKAAARLIR